MKYFTKEWYRQLKTANKDAALQEALERPPQEYATYLKEKNLTAIDRKLHYHQWQVSVAYRRGNDFFIHLQHPNEAEPTVTLRMIDTRMIGQELGEELGNAYVWLHHEVDLTSFGYELRLLLAEKGSAALMEWTVDCARMELAEFDL